ncbi:ATP-dependent endonuclease [Microbacterium sp. CFH 31415]|uniref:TOPRIM nucleotidyl transferase/hydrolase domain-containing protein n=1 Tax=Microbacterium sp. CFH 31415 TaxID=2921732 RepID=UPI001F12BE87|nr:TOPRIM nucleotidyl transferase/hydrolase domain-containing protein [Microbacterium sp. CFH 31415]MCH6230052.1 ATP-dependent endonuclease [Microbacterium sp. CFH 31415]
MRERRRELARHALEGYPDGPAAALVAHTALESLDTIAALHGIVLVEGVSDRIAVEAVARRRGTDLSGIGVVPTGGAQGIGRMLRTLAVRHPGVTVAGVNDVAESAVVRHALAAAGLLEPGADAASAGFFSCVDDLEDELLRGVGLDHVEDCLAAQSDLASFRRMQQQPQWRDQDLHAQLRRWLAGGARRKLRYARILVEAMPLERMPRPLLAALDRVAATR